jgi:hypothetical protein
MIVATPNTEITLAQTSAITIDIVVTSATDVSITPTSEITIDVEAP